MTLTPLSKIGAFYASSVGKKIVVAVTAIALLLFLPGHAIGNLLIFAGPEALNAYAEFLHTMGHGAGIWVFRIGILAAFGIHIIATIQLARQNRAARSDRYSLKASQRSTLASRTMIVTGLIIIAFVIFHILHYTVRVSEEFRELPMAMVDGREVFDVYSMVILGFQNIPVSIFYILAISLLCVHLTHGVQSVFQTLGLRSRKTEGVITLFARLYTIFVWVGFVIVPLAVVFGLIGLPETAAN